MHFWKIANQPRTLITFLLVLFLANTIASLAANGPGEPALNKTQQAELVKDLTEGLDSTYVFPDVATKMIALLNDNLKAGTYDTLTDLSAFTNRLTEDMYSVAHDKHLHVDPFHPRKMPEGARPSGQERRAHQLKQAQLNNFGFHKLERLAGNIGYLDLRGFNEAEIAGPTAIAAMNFLANSSGLIIDLRKNGGGSPSMIQLISSYFFTEKQHLNTFYIRSSNSHEEYWTQEEVKGPKMVDTPIYVLTSNSTFSAAEEFTYNLKHMKRATIVGQTTGGGAHPINSFVSEMGGEFYARVSMPFGRAINPITGTNWEGVGVKPHIEVPADKALERAHFEMVNSLAKDEADPERKFMLEWARAGLNAQRNPLKLDLAAARSVAGQYGPRKVSFDHGKLFYQRADGPRYELLPMAVDLYRVSELDYFRVQFKRDAKGMAVELIGNYNNGRTDSNPRSGPES